MRKIWATTELMPFSDATLAAANAAGATEIVELPYQSIPDLVEGFTEIDDTAVPQSVTAFQAKGALLNAGLYQTVVNWMATASPLIQLAWQEAPTFGRNDVSIAAIAGALNLTPAQLDAMFIAASQISV